MQINLHSFRFEPFSIEIAFHTWEELDKYCDCIAKNNDMYVAFMMLRSVRDMTKPKKMHGFQHSQESEK